MVTPRLVLLTYLRSNEVDIGNREPTYEDWLRLTSTGMATYPIMFMRFVHKMSLETIAEEFATLWSYLSQHEPHDFFAGWGILYIPDYFGDIFTIKEGLLMQLVGDEMGVIVMRESEDPDFDSDSE